MDFLQYIKGNPPTGKLAKDIDDEIKIVKCGEKWRMDYMTWEMEMRVREEIAAEKAIEKGRAEGKKEGKDNERVMVIRRMAKAKKEISDIEVATGLSAKEIGALAKRHKISL